jgi:hypothetical protein
VKIGIEEGVMFSCEGEGGENVLVVFCMLPIE